MAGSSDADPRRAGLMTSKKAPLAWPAISPSERELAVVIRNAWSTHRLGDIQEIVEAVVATLVPAQLVGSIALASSPQETDVLARIVQEAVMTCSQELRRGCGLPAEAEAPGEPERSRTQWSVKAYEAALARVRSAAVVALEASFEQTRAGVKAAPVVPPSSAAET